MAALDSNGVLVAYFGFDGSLEPRIHLPDSCGSWKRSHRVWEHTELFPDLESTRERLRFLWDLSP